MTFREAMQAMLDGKKVRQPDWKKGFFIWLDGNYVTDQMNAIYFLKLSDYESKDWEVCQEPNEPKEWFVWENEMTGNILVVHAGDERESWYGWKKIKVREII